MDTVKHILLGLIVGALMAINTSIQDVAHVLRYKEASAVEKPASFLSAAAYAQHPIREWDTPIPKEAKPMKERVIVPSTLPNRRDGIADDVEEDVKIYGYPGVWSDRSRRLQELRLRNQLYIYDNRE